MSKINRLLLGLLLLATGALVGWNVRTLFSPAPAEGEADGDEEPDAPELAPADMRVRVTTAAATAGELPIVVAAVGVVQAEPAAERILSSRAGGRVIEALAAKGAFVKQGDLLLRFDPVPLQAAVVEARAALAQAANQLAEYEQSGRDRQLVELQTAAQRTASLVKLLEAQQGRLEALHNDGLVSDRALAEAQQAAEQARADQALAEKAAASFKASGGELQHATLVAARAAAEAGVQEAERVLSEADVPAPRDGQLVEFSARTGEKLEPGAVLGRLLAREGRWIAFGVAPTATGELKVGSRAAWDDAQGVRRTGTLVNIGGEIDAASGLLRAIVAPDAGVPTMPPGLVVRGELELRRLGGAVLVPDSAILRAHDEQVVVLNDGGHAKVVQVRVLGRHAGLAAIEGEIHAADRVVISGGYNLPDGASLVEDDAPPRTDSPGGGSAAHGRDKQ